MSFHCNEIMIIYDPLAVCTNVSYTLPVYECSSNTPLLLMESVWEIYMYHQNEGFLMEINPILRPG